MKKYKVVNYSVNGTRSDDRFIGIYDTIEEAKLARKKYFADNVGSGGGTLEQFCMANGYDPTDPDGIDDYNTCRQKMEEYTSVEEIENLY